MSLYMYVHITALTVYLQSITAIGRIKYLELQNSHSAQIINNILFVCIYLCHNHLCNDVMLPVSKNSFKT